MALINKKEAIYKEPFPKTKRGDEFGNLAPYRNGRPHRGQDWSPKENSPIKAVTSGTVMEVGWSDILGNYLIQSTYDKLFVIYAHLSKTTTLKKGDKVVVGESVIGLVGGGVNTPSGTASTGAHLHLSIGKKKNVHTCAYSDLIDPLTKFGVK